MRGRSAAAVAVIALLASAVGGSATSSELEGVTLTYWTSWDDQPGVAALIERFERETGAAFDEVVLAPSYEAEVLSLWDQGERPDLMTFLPDRSWLLDLDPTRTLVDLSGEAFVERDLFGIADAGGRIEGKLHAAPFAYPEVYGMLYGRQGAEDYAIPTGLDELYEACSDYFTAGHDGAFIHIGGERDIRTLDIFPSILWADAVSAGIVEELDAGSTSFTDYRIVEAINALGSGMVRACLNHDDYHTATYDTQLERLMDGSAAMIPQGISAVADLVERFGKETVDERVGFFPLAFRSSRASWAARPDSAFLVPVNEDPARQEAALAFVRFALGDGYEEYVTASGLPPVLDGVDIPDGVPVPVREAHEAMLAGAAPTIDTIIRAPYGDLDQWLYEMLGGTKTPDDVAFAMEETFASTTGG